ncbi:MAG: acetylxylan esterase [Gemmataceae bacterium]|nr:acetylxylan esterase [Gemmataceae bacterium]MDW8266060.1 acetylxylan esterase [Gemmataceae bacterium]
MRPIVVFVILLAGAISVRAQEDLTVLRVDTDGVPPTRQLYTYLLKEAQRHFDERRQAVAALKTPEDVHRRQAELRQFFLQAIGAFPEKTPLNPRIVGRIQGDGYRIEKVIYESRPNHHVTALLYLPDVPPPYPGVLLPCGHSANGKAAESYQRAAILMAKNGLAVLCYDPIGQGERLQLLDASGKPAISSNTSEHTLVGIGALLVGRNTAHYRIWDGIRSLDYLASRPEIDPRRLGCTGNSGGGTLTAYLMALDDRIVAAAPACYITSLERLFSTVGPQDAEQNITGQVAFGMEHADYLTMRAPKPTLLCVATQDFFDIAGAWTTFREAKLIYGLLGHGERVDLVEFNDKHGFSKPRREAAMRWMRRWLLQRDDAPREEDFPIYTDRELQCTRTGQVLEDFRGKSAFALNAEREQELAERRNARPLARHTQELGRELWEKIGAPIVGRMTVEKVGSVPRDSYVIDKVVYTTTPGIQVPGLFFRPNRAKETDPLTIYLHGDGKAVDAGVGGPIEKLVRSGQRVLALDLRGMGETSPGKSAAAGWSHYFGFDPKEAFLGLHLNRPLLGQRVYDLQTIIDGLALDPSVPIHVHAIGAAGPIALHAAVLERRISRLTLERSLISWSAVVRSPISFNQLTNVVPGALEVYDLPDLAALVAPRPLTIRAAVDPRHQPVTQAELEAAYRPCRSAYQSAGAADRLVLEAAP